jgi:hypothetical protein
MFGLTPEFVEKDRLSHSSQPVQDDPPVRTALPRLREQQIKRIYFRLAASQLEWPPPGAGRVRVKGTLHISYYIGL